MQAQKSSFGERVDHALTVRGLQRVDLARYCGMSPSAVTQWISGQTKSYDAMRIAKAAEFLRVRYEWLLRGDGPMDASDVAETAGQLFDELPAEAAQITFDFLELQLKRSLAADPAKLGAYLKMIDRIRSAKK